MAKLARVPACVRSWARLSVRTWLLAAAFAAAACGEKGEGARNPGAGAGGGSAASGGVTGGAAGFFSTGGANGGTAGGASGGTASGTAGAGAAGAGGVGAVGGVGGASAGSGGAGGAAGLGGMTMTGDVPTLVVGGGTLKLEVCAADVIRVLFATDPAFFTRTSLAAAPKRCDAATPWELVEEAGTRIVRTTRVELRVDTATGQIAFYDREQRLIVAEKAGSGRTLEPVTIQGEATNHVRQEWEPNDGEALYGLGNYQHGLLDIKGYDVELSQYNTNAVVPTLVSSRGYGIFWDNTSYTRFVDLREYEPVPGVTYDSSGNVDGAASGSVNVMVEVMPPVTGDYLFKTFASGDVKLTVGEALVIDHWRQGWLPDEEVARVRLTAGQAVPVRLQWTSDIDVNTLSLTWKPPSETPSTTSLWSDVGEGIDYYYLFGPELDRVVSGYRRVTGQASMLPRWAFGLFQSRERYTSAAELTETVAGHRSRNIPLDVIVQDWRYWVDGQWGSHEFDATRFPDPKALVDGLHEQNVKFMISVWPKFYTNTANYAALEQAGFMYPYEEGVVDFLQQPFAFYDAFNAQARAMVWQQMDQRLFSLGVDGWWLDATEPEVVEGPYTSLAQGRQLYQTHMHPTAAGTGSRVLNAYSLVNSQGIYEGQRAKAPDQRVFILTRSAFGGQQRYASVTWSGDISSTWSSFKKQIPGGLGFSLSGIPYWTVDSGGFAVPPHFANGENAAEWQELNTRWFEYATFLPLLRVHGQAPVREIWAFGGDSSPAYQAMLKFDRLRYRLLPYVYSLAGAATHRDGTMLRPLVMDFRTDAAALDVRDQFMFGPALLVSPVTSYQATSRSLYLPATAGGWYDFWTGETAAGGTTLTAPAPLDAIPVHVRAGSIIPFGPELNYTSEKPADPITIFVYAGANGAFELYEDDGASYGYESGAFARIPLGWNDATSTLSIGAREGSYPGMLASRTFEVVIVRPGKAVPFSFAPVADKAVAYDGTALELPLP
jgi:alpha-D-xyloside xylohydrolase